MGAMTRCRRLRALLAILILSITIGCVATTLRETQNHFNKGAEIELRAMNVSLSGDLPAANPGDIFAALNEYRLAHSKATELIREKSNELKEDNLLGATYVLKAMSLWRISDLEGEELQEKEKPGAEKAAEEMATARQKLLKLLDTMETKMEEGKITLGTRDKVHHKALYGFYDHDGGRAADEYSEAKLWFESAYKRLEESLKVGVPERHPIRVYVGSAQLRTLAAWNEAIYANRKKCKQSCKEEMDDEEDKITEKTKTTICDLEVFWANDEEMKTGLKKLLVPIGLINIFDCN